MDPPREASRREQSGVGDRVERALEDRADVEGAIERAEGRSPSRAVIVKRALWLGVTGVSLYLVAPSVLDVLASWNDIRRFSPGWLLAMLVLQAMAIACLCALQALAMHTRQWYAVVTSQMAGNALAKIAPGGGAVGAALQYKMLVVAGLRQATAVAGLTAANLLTLAAVLALPVLAVPAIVRGAVDRNLVEVTVIGAVVFVVLFAIGTVCLTTDGLLRWVGRIVQRVRNRLRRKSAEPLSGLPSRLLRERDRITATLGPRWKRALAATIGRWAFDYFTLLAALAAVGSHPRPSLVLLAFCAAQLLAQIPVTPGGLGFVEAGLTAMLGLAGVGAGTAVLATFAYRLFSYWLPMPAGVVGWFLHHRRYAAGA